MLNRKVLGLILSYVFSLRVPPTRRALGNISTLGPKLITEYRPRVFTFLTFS